MPLELGSAFRPREIPPPPEPHRVSVEDLRAEQLLFALQRLEQALHNQPTPQIHVEQPDLSAIVTAVTSLKPGATAEDIAAAVVSQIGGGTERPMEQVLSELTKTMKQLEFRITGFAGTGGGGGPSSVDLNPNTITALTQPTEISNDVGNPIPVSLSAGTNFLGYTGSYEDDASKQGRYRFAGGKATTSLTTPNASITLLNPVGSLVDLILTRYQVEVDAAADVVLVMDATSTGAVSENLNPNTRTAVANPGVVRVGAGVLTGGTVSSVIRRAQPNSPVAVGPFRFRVTPGKSFTVRFLGPGATNTVWFNMGWFVVNEGADLA